MALPERGQIAGRGQDLPKTLVFALELKLAFPYPLKSGNLELKPAVSLPQPFHNETKQPERGDADKEKKRLDSHSLSSWLRGTNPWVRPAPKPGPCLPLASPSERLEPARFHPPARC